MTKSRASVGKENGNGKEGIAFNRQLLNITQNLVLERKLWLQRLLDPRRDIDAECGHPQTATVLDYKNLFLRGDIAARVVTCLPQESWSENPDVFETEDEDETEFEKAWVALEKELKLYAVLERLDILSGIGRFGILLLGFDDGAPLMEEVIGTGRKLLYVRPFDEELVQIQKLETDKASPRFGLPTAYQIRYEDALSNPIAGGNPASATTFENVVHWTRVIHVADNRMSSDVFGLPRMELVLNRLLDIKKIAGGSGEMFWKGGFPGISLEAPVGPDETINIDMVETKEQMDRYMNGLQRYLVNVGMQAKSLGVQVADPMPHIDAHIKLIAMAISVPWRVFVGSEAAQLASEQDSRSWYRRLGRRRENYVTPYIIKPLVERLMQFGVLPTIEEVQVHWPDLNTLSEIDKATVAEKLTNAISKYAQAGADIVIPLFHYLTLVLEFDDEEADAIMDELGDRALETDPEGDQQQQQDGAEAQREHELELARIKSTPARNMVWNEDEGRWVTIDGHPVLIKGGNEGGGGQDKEGGKEEGGRIGGSKGVKDFVNNNTLEGDLKSKVDSALESIDAVHALPDTGREVDISRMEKAVFGNMGSYHPGIGLIAISGESPEMAVAHEMGHHIDNSILGNGDYLSANFGEPPSDIPEHFRAEYKKTGERLIPEHLRTEYIELGESLMSSASVKGLKMIGGTSKKDKAFRQYISSPVEVFARGYAQYIATRSGNAAMQKQIKSAANLHWSEKEFAPIADKFDNLFKAANKK